MISNKNKKIQEYKRWRSITPSSSCEYYDCCRPPIFYFVTTDKWCCNRNSKRCPGIKNKTAETNMQKYGVDNPSMIEDIKKKKKDTLKTHFDNMGLSHVDIRNKKEKTNIEKYGVKNPSQNVMVQEKRNNTFLEKYDGHPLCNSNIIQKRKDTLLEKYGVDNYGKTQTHKNNLVEYYNNLPEESVKARVDKIIKTKLNLGLITDPALSSEFERYYIDVRNLSDRNYKKYKKIINPNNFNRGRTSYHLDHIFSIKEAFENNVPVEVVSDRSNLRMMKYDENIAKGGLSDKSLLELFEDFHRNT